MHIFEATYWQKLPNFTEFVQETLPARGGIVMLKLHSYGLQVGIGEDQSPSTGSCLKKRIRFDKK